MWMAPWASYFELRAKTISFREDDLGKENKRTGHGLVNSRRIDNARGGGHEDFCSMERKTKDLSWKEKIEEYNRFKSAYSGRIIINLVAIPVILSVLTSWVIKIRMLSYFVKNNGLF